MKIVKEAWITACGGAAGPYPPLSSHPPHLCPSRCTPLLSDVSPLLELSRSAGPCPPLSSHPPRLCPPYAHLCFLPSRVSGAPHTAAGSPALAPSDRPGHNYVFRATSLALSTFFLVLGVHCEMCCLPSTPKGTSYFGTSHPSLWLESSKIKLFVYVGRREGPLQLLVT